MEVPMTVAESLDLIRCKQGCVVNPPAGLPQLPEGLSLPLSITEFYSACGGVDFNTNSAQAFVWRIVSPLDFRPAGYSVYGMEDQEVEFLGHWTDSMFLFATTRHGEDRVVVDCGGQYDGFFLDGDHETFATENMILVSRSLPDLLTRIAESAFEVLPHVTSVPRPIRLRDL